jgi:hypothetical protein
MLVVMNHAFDLRARDLLLFLRECEGDLPDRPYSSDGVATFAPLIATGLAQATHRESGSGGWAPSFATFEVRLTDRGHALLHAWETGDDADYRHLVGGA